LIEFELIDVKFAKDNTRYFCINDEKLINFENIDINTLLKIDESKKSSELESNNIANSESKKDAVFENPFNKNENKKININNNKIIVQNNNTIKNNIKTTTFVENKLLMLFLEEF
jgi:hypothetical protein